MIDSHVAKLIAVVVLLILVSFILILTKNKGKTRKEKVKEKEKPANRRDNFRIRVNIKNTLMEVLKIGSIDVNEFNYCEIVDVSAGGVGIQSDYDFPLRQKVYVRMHFNLNDEEFSLNGRIARKIESLHKRSVFYGIQFINLSTNDENRLIKEIVAMENQRRKIQVG
jgi:c-di-GMP-binding flagellar brake protein YcgR